MIKSAVPISAFHVNPTPTATTSASPRGERLGVGGHQVAQDLCADCHAVERIGDSRNPNAPAFRTILKDYPPEWLATDLRDGRALAFRQMPVFHFGEGHEYDLVAYLLSIQEAPSPRPSTGPSTQR